LTAATLPLALVWLGEAEPARALGGDSLQRGRQALDLDHLITLLLAQAIGIGPHTRCGCSRGPPGSAAVHI
jgi:hypothetical protein